MTPTPRPEREPTITDAIRWLSDHTDGKKLHRRTCATQAGGRSQPGSVGPSCDCGLWDLLDRLKALRAPSREPGPEPGTFRCLACDKVGTLDPEGRCTGCGYGVVEPVAARATEGADSGEDEREARSCRHCGCLIGTTESTLQCPDSPHPFLYHDFTMSADARVIAEALSEFVTEYTAIPFKVMRGSDWLAREIASRLRARLPDSPPRPEDAE